MKKDTSWGSVSGWYDDLLEGSNDTYQSRVILPNLLRLMDIKSGNKVLELGCGQGFFCREFQKVGAKVFGVDVSSELIKIARDRSPKDITYSVSTADAIPKISDSSFDFVVIILAIQNVNSIDSVFKEAARVLKSKGHMYIVLNHPTFRIPKRSSWGFDDKVGIQYRRLDGYMTESQVAIEMNPSSPTPIKTVSFHRPLQVYFKSLAKYGLVVSRLEEWISDKKSEFGPRAKAEDIARHEFPLFMCLEACKKV